MFFRNRMYDKFFHMRYIYYMDGFLFWQILNERTIKDADILHTRFAKLQSDFESQLITTDQLTAENQARVTELKVLLKSIVTAWFIFFSGTIRKYTVELYKCILQTVIFGSPLMLNSDKEVLITLNARIYYLEDIFCSHEVWDKKAGLSLRKSELFWDFYFLFISHFWLYMVLWYNYSKKRMRLTSSKGRLSDWTKWGKPFKGNFGRWRRISQMSSSRGRLSKVRSLAWKEVMQ